MDCPHRKKKMEAATAFSMRRPHSTKQKKVQGKCPFILFIFMGPFARTLFS